MSFIVFPPKKRVLYHEFPLVQDEGRAIDTPLTSLSTETGFSHLPAEVLLVGQQTSARPRHA